MAHLLVVGSAVLDLVFTVSRHPGEDEELRADALRVSPGGNAANTALVLRRLGHEVALGAALADHPAAAPLEEALRSAGVDLTPCRRVAGMPPLSAILLRAPGGRRTIIHHRSTPEYDLEDLGPQDLAPYRWARFEGRPGPGTRRMIRHARLFRPDLLLSLEVEKVRQGTEELLPFVRLAIFSRGFAKNVALTTIVAGVAVLSLATTLWLRPAPDLPLPAALGTVQQPEAATATEQPALASPVPDGVPVVKAASTPGTTPADTNSSVKATAGRPRLNQKNARTDKAKEAGGQKYDALKKAWGG